MIFQENCLLAGDSHKISYLIFSRKLGKMSQNLSSAAVVIGALEPIQAVDCTQQTCPCIPLYLGSGTHFHETSRISSKLLKVV